MTTADGVARRSACHRAIRRNTALAVIVTLLLVSTTACGLWRNRLGLEAAGKKITKFLGLSASAQHDIPAEVQPLILRHGANAPCALVTPALLAAQLFQESGANPNTRSSPAGAQGIAQFMPATWQRHGVDGNGDGVRNILDPEDAVPAAAKYDCTVAGSVRKVPGDPIDNMLAAYNAGAGAVIRYQGVPPYRETQNYVKAIRTLMARYAEKVEVPDAGPKAATFGAEIVRQARTQLGVPYVFGGGAVNGPSAALKNGPKGFDCSSLVRFAVQQARVTFGAHDLPPIQRTTWGQIADGSGREVPFNQLQLGDAIYISWDKANDHVVIYAGKDADGNDLIIEAPRPGKNVREASLSQYSGHISTVRRFGTWRDGTTAQA